MVSGGRPEPYGKVLQKQDLPVDTSLGKGHTVHEVARDTSYLPAKQFAQLPTNSVNSSTGNINSMAGRSAFVKKHGISENERHKSDRRRNGK